MDVNFAAMKHTTVAEIVTHKRVSTDILIARARLCHECCAATKPTWTRAIVSHESLASSAKTPTTTTKTINTKSSEKKNWRDPVKPVLDFQPQIMMQKKTSTVLCTAKTMLCHVHCALPDAHDRAHHDHSRGHGQAQDPLVGDQPRVTCQLHHHLGRHNHHGEWHFIMAPVESIAAVNEPVAAHKLLAN